MHEPFLRAAVRFQSVLDCGSNYRRPWLSSAEQVSHYLHAFSSELKLMLVAGSKGWEAAEHQMKDRAARSLRMLCVSAKDLQTRFEVTPIPPRRSSVADLLEELKQLRQEFAEVELDLRSKTISVVTGDIELSGEHLGPFQIELRLERMRTHPDISAFAVEALEPHPAASSDDIVHPHVQAQHLCAGEATVPIAHALADRRLCDAFLAIRAVLETYNPASAYIRLEEWSGTSCQDCGRITDEDNLYRCEQCDARVCDRCYTYCDICDATVCRSCLETDAVSRRQCCPHCRRRCGQCARVVDVDNFHEELELCPGCRDEAEQSNEQENPDEPNDLDSHSGERCGAAGGESSDPAGKADGS